VDVIPVTACWSAGGLPIYRQAPEMFRRAALEIAAAEYRQAVVNFRDSYGSERG
jgi:hypothetical protein